MITVNKFEINFNSHIALIYIILAVPGHVLLWLSPIPSRPVPSHPTPSHRIPSRHVAYLNATLCQNLKAIGEELSEIVSGSTASSPDIDVLYIYKHAYSNATLCQNFKAIGEELSEF
jgi:hypothetical protein